MDTLLVPRLLWRHALGADDKPRMVLAHSPSVYELLVPSLEGLTAMGVDISQGVLWRETVEDGLVYVGRGVRLDSDRLVDVAGNTLLKLRLGHVQKALIGRRVVAAIGTKRAKVIDKLVIEEIAELDAKTILVKSDEYSIGLAGRTSRRKYAVIADTMYGLWVVEARRPLKSISVANGCVLACNPMGCIVSNGSFAASIAGTDAEPLAAVNGACLIAMQSDKRWVVMLVGEALLEAIDSCDSKPTVLYFDGVLVYYACGASIRSFNAKTTEVSLEKLPTGAIPTPTRPLRVTREEDYTILVLGGDEETRVLIPVQHLYKIHQDRLLALSAGWLYSLDLRSMDRVDVSIEEDACPLGVRIETPGYRVIRVDVEDGIRVARKNLTSSTAFLCLEPVELKPAYTPRLVMHLAPPLVIDTFVSLGPVKPEIHATLLRLENGDAVYVDGQLIEARPGAVILEVREPWYKLLQGAQLKLMEGDNVTYTALLTRQLQVLPYTGRGKPRVAIQHKGFEYTLEVTEKLIVNLDELRYSVVKVKPLSLEEAEAQLSSNADLIVVDNRACTAAKPGFTCHVRIHDGNTIYLCRETSLRGIYACSLASDREIRKTLHDVMAVVEALESQPYVILGDEDTTLRLRARTRKPGLVVVEVDVNGAKKVSNVMLASDKLEVEVGTLKPGIYNARITLSAFNDVMEVATKILVHKPARVLVVRTPRSTRICCNTTCLVSYGNEVTILDHECAKIGVSGYPRVYALDECGSLTATHIEELDVATALRNAVITAKLLADKLGLF